MKKKWIVSFFALLLICGLAACKSADEAKQKTGKVQTKTSASQGKDNEQDIYPLTGKPVDHKVDRRPFGVMINNHPQARPQSGVYDADVVYEALAEGEITRFLALFQSKQPKIIGPVRSARPYFVKLNNAYDAIYVHHGWSPQAKKLIKSTGTNNLNGLYYDGTLFHRADFRQAPHNSYIPYKNIEKGVEEKGYKRKADVDPLPFLNQDEIKNLNGDQADGVTIDYKDKYQVRFAYQSDDGTYQRYSDGGKSVDRETKTPITVSNVLIVAAPHRFIDSYPRRGINLKAGGQALLLQKGKVQKLEWKNVKGRIVPVKDGKTVGFVPGQTWINIIPDDPGLNGAVKIAKGDHNGD